LRHPSATAFQFKPITNSDTLKLIDSLKPKTSTGCDRISSALLKQIKSEIFEPLTFIINQSLQTGIFPNRLKIAKVLPVYKKGDKNSIENYRPISILSAISKVIEKAICQQINQHFKVNKLYYNSQYGFRESHSTELATLEVIDRIILDLDQGSLPLNIYIDLSKAFHTIDHNKLVYLEL